jgi:predicted SnoaL-like aldol condensation-catalyzing enzyme
MDAKRIATEFLQMAARGEAKEAARKYCTPNCKHHNVYFASGIQVLAQAMDDDSRANPNKALNMKHVLGDGDLIAVHSQVVRETGEQIAVVHLFRFEGDKIAEFWDVGQLIPKDSPNTDGPF